MRVLHLDSETSLRGGQRQVELLARALSERGATQALVAPRDSRLAPRLRELGLDIFPYEPGRWLGLRSPRLRGWLRATARDFGADLAHAHSAKAHTLAAAALAGRLPLVVTRRVDFPVRNNPLSRWKYRHPALRFIAISNGVAGVLRDGGVPAERIDVVWSGVDPARVAGGEGSRLREEWLAGRPGPVIGFVGALVDHKAPWILAEAAPAICRDLPGARIVFVGDGAERPRLEHLAAGNDALHLAGWRDDIADVYAALDLFVMPSKLEGLCTALVDALFAGVPAIGSRTGGIPDVLLDGETGLLVPPLDPDALARAVVDLWNNPARRELLARRGREHARARFTADAMAGGTYAVYTRILSSHRS